MSFSSVIHKVTPWIATAASIIAPGAGPIIQLAAKALSGGLGVTVASDSQSISNAITTAMANPDQLATLKKIDDDFAVQMKQLGFQNIEDLAKIDADDRASARAMQTQTRSLMPALLAGAAVFTLLACIYLLAFRTLPPSGKDAILILLGAVVASYKDVYGFFFGSSAGSERQTELLSQAPPVQK